MTAGTEPRAEPTRVVLVDDQELVRTGLARILRPRDGFAVVGECSDGSGVEALVDACRPDVVVMDLRMKVVDGIEATRRLQARPEPPPVLVLTTFDDDELLSGALRAGAAGFALKDAPAEDLIRAVREVAGGGAWLDPSVTGRVLAAYRHAAPAARPRPCAGPAHAPRAGGPRPRRSGAQQRGGGRRAGDLRADGQEPHRARLRQARAARPGGGHRLRLRPRRRRARPTAG